MIPYIENPKDATRIVLELNEFNKVAGYKINIQKSIAFLYAKSERSEREIKVTVPLTITSKRIKYLGINLPKDTKDFPSSSARKESACNAGNPSSIPESGRSPGEGIGYPLLGYPGCSDGKESACNAGNLGSILGFRRTIKGLFLYKC